MPNHIKNKIEIIGSLADIDSILKTFGTDVPASVKMTHDNDLVICKSKTKEHGFCWLDLKTGKVHDRGELKQIGLPDDFEIELDDAFFCFPDFKKVIPPPSDDPAYNDKPSQEIAKKSPNWWYNWNIKNWGTKWSAYTCQKEAINIYTFETAWSPVHKIIEAMSNRFPALVIKYTWADEDSGYNCGRATYQKGMGEIYIPEGGSINAYDIYFELNPESKSNYAIVDGKYKYIEEEVEE